MKYGLQGVQDTEGLFSVINNTRIVCFLAVTTTLKPRYIFIGDGLDW